MGSSPTFDEKTVPTALSEEHALAPGRWGVLQLMEGSVFFVDLESGDESHLTAPDLVVIAPEAPHKLRLDGPLSCRIDFFREMGDEPPARTLAAAARGEVRLSFDRCEATGDFAERFYEIFLAASPEVAPYFAQTDFAKQRKLLRATVYIMVTRDTWDPQMREALDRIGRSHSRSQFNIPPRLYEIWLDSVCETVEALDTEWTNDLEKLWRIRLRDGMQVITAAY
jgi:tellurite resistance-related uncharacterized protein/hemoglobin-like flavoprotein